jgi:hypothetical protein
MSLTIVADDLTGACDTGSLFAGHAPVSLALWPAAPPRAAVRVVDTESRAIPAEVAMARVARVPALAPATRYFKKIDSTLRGHVGLEIDALMRAVGVRSALVCPAFPAQGRVVIERLLLIDGVPLTDTPLARDPEFPPVASSSVVDVLRSRVDRISPAIEEARAEGLTVIGPLPADTLFSRARGGEFDIVVAMYHDQGHVPVKTLGFTYDEASGRWTGLSGVNVTVGLPFLRVSVDHGTAFDRAWKGIANHESMVEAIDVAVRMLTLGP